MQADTPDPVLPPKGSRAEFRRFGVEALIVGGGRFLTRIATFLTGVLIARLLGPEGRGLVAALQVPSLLAINLAEAGVRQSTAYHVGRGSFPVARTTATVLAMLPVTSILAVLLALGYFRLADVAAGDWTLQLLAVAVIPSGVGVAYVGGVLLGLGKISLFSRSSWMPAAIVLAATAAIAWGLGWGPYGVLAAAVIGNVAGFAYALVILSRQVPLGFRIDRAVLRGIRSHGIMYAVASLALVLNYKIMVLILSWSAPLEQVGYYSQAASIAELLWEVPQIVSSLLFARSVNARQADEMSVKVLMFARMAGLFVLGAAIVVAAISPWFFPFVYGARFAPSALVCTALLPGVVAVVIWRILQADVHGRGRAWATAAIIGPAIVVNIGLGYWLASGYGAVGAAIASSVTFILATVAYAIFYSRLTSIPLGEMVRFRRSDFAKIVRSLPVPAGMKRWFGMHS